MSIAQASPFQHACLYFGTFNPIHTGHLMIAQAALTQFAPLLNIQRVVFIPAGNPPHRFQQADLLDSQHRYHMVRLAIASHPAFFVSDIELRGLPSATASKRLDENKAPEQLPSYTIHTLRHLIATENLPTPVPMIIGADALANLSTWKEPQALIETVHFLQAPRPQTEFVRQIEIQGQTLPLRTTPIEMPALALSSTWIRQQLQQAEFRHPEAFQKNPSTQLAHCRYFLPEPVRQYIRDNALYQ